MKIIEIIKNKFKSFFNRSKALPEGCGENKSVLPEDRGIILLREDGTKIKISPMLDKVGNQELQEVYNIRTETRQYIPKYCIMCDELKELVHPQCLQKLVLMDMNLEQYNRLFQDSEYATTVANSFLNKDRMGKILGEYGGYAGGLEIDDTGSIKGKYVDNGIIKSLKYIREQEIEKMKRINKESDEAHRRGIEEKARRQGVHVKTSHATILSDSLYNEMER